MSRTQADAGGASVLFAFEDVAVVAPDGTRVLDEVTLELPADRTTVVVGPSGAGKSTLLRLCNRLEVPTSGTVRFHGTPLDELDPRAHRRRVGMVFQHPTTFPGWGQPAGRRTPAMARCTTSCRPSGSTGASTIARRMRCRGARPNGCASPGRC